MSDVLNTEDIIVKGHTEVGGGPENFYGNHIQNPSSSCCHVYGHSLLSVCDMFCVYRLTSLPYVA
jgi:hypothetical protein